MFIKAKGYFSHVQGKYNSNLAYQEKLAHGLEIQSQTAKQTPIECDLKAYMYACMWPRGVASTTKKSSKSYKKKKTESGVLNYM